jgi:DNA-binding protein YbaB
MFEKLQQLKQLKELQDSLKKEKTIVEKEGIRIVINGKLEIEEIELNSALNKEEQERVLKDCLNTAMKKVQTNMAQKLSQMGNLGF